MKKLFILIITIIIYNTTFGQSSKYVHYPELDKFVGEWAYNENGKKVEIILKKVVVDVKDGSLDMLQGYHIFTNDGKIIENTLGLNQPSLTSGGISFDNDVKNPNQVRILFYDPTRKKSGEVILRFLPGTPNKLQWTLMNSESIRMHHHNEPKFDGSFTLPKEMTLVREP